MDCRCQEREEEKRGIEDRRRWWWVEDTKKRIEKEKKGKGREVEDMLGKR